MNNKHTPGPWFYNDEWSGVYDSPDLRGASVRICEIVRTPDYIANAEFIVRACNAHYDLVNALERISIIRQDSGDSSTRDLVNECVSISKNALGKVK